jgi:hypothetical protein
MQASHWSVTFINHKVCAPNVHCILHREYEVCESYEYELLTKWVWTKLIKLYTCSAVCISLYVQAPALSQCCQTITEGHVWLFMARVLPIQIDNSGLAVAAMWWLSHVFSVLVVLT